MGPVYIFYEGLTSQTHLPACKSVFGTVAKFW